MRQTHLGPMFAVSLLLAGCSRLPPPNLYVLSPAVKDGGSDAAAPTVAIVRVRLPDYLDRREIVSRKGTNGLQLNDDNRWGEPLSENMQRVLAEDLTSFLANARAVIPEEGRGKNIPYEYLLTLDAFEPDGDQVVMRGHWQLRDLHSGKTVSEGPIDQVRKANPKDYPAIVGALNQDLNDAGRQIAEATEPAIRR